ncbi:hypothetical protein ACQ4M4_24685 [Leptolyngbya sp. AN02str]|uniref:hypothetical protein n=1 Tax=Leptolyngbya sp. AN02str TaxID=3423363 RepID=UPI003D31F11A
MKRSIKSIAALSSLAVLAVAPVVFSANSASALPLARGMNGNYLGAGISAGVTEDASGDSTFGANVQGRFDVPLAPVSVRGAALFGDDSVALMPIVTYDAAIAPNTNLYLGGGYSFVTNEGNSTPLGDKNAPVITAGVETAVLSNVVVYGDAKVGFDAYRNSNDAAVSLQLGAAYRF